MSERVESGASVSERVESGPGAEARVPRTLLALDADAFSQFVVALGGKPFHARIARENVLGKGILDYAAMTSLPAQLRARLAAELPILAGREIDRSVASDRTTKLLIEFPRDKRAQDGGGGRPRRDRRDRAHAFALHERRRRRRARRDVVRFDADRLPGRVSVLRVRPARSPAQPRAPRDPRAVRARPRARPARAQRRDGHGRAALELRRT